MLGNVVRTYVMLNVAHGSMVSQIVTNIIDFGPELIRSLLQYRKIANNQISYLEVVKNRLTLMAHDYDVGNTVIIRNDCTRLLPIFRGKKAMIEEMDMGKKLDGLKYGISYMRIHCPELKTRVWVGQNDIKPVEYEDMQTTVTFDMFKDGIGAIGNIKGEN